MYILKSTSTEYPMKTFLDTFSSPQDPPIQFFLYVLLFALIYRAFKTNAIVYHHNKPNFHSFLHVIRLRWRVGGRWGRGGDDVRYTSNHLWLDPLRLRILPYLPTHLSQFITSDEKEKPFFSLFFWVFCVIAFISTLLADVIIILYWGIAVVWFVSCFLYFQPFAWLLFDV